MRLDWRDLIVRPLRRVLGYFRSTRPADSDSVTELGERQICRLLEFVFSTQPHELTCGECFDQVECFAELDLMGDDAARLMPLVIDHLDRCADCREEYKALLDAIRL